MACEIDIFDAIVLSPTTPQDEDILIFLLPTKDVVGRTWANVKTALVPNDYYNIITDGAHVDGEIHSGESVVVLDQFKNFRVRVERNRSGDWDATNAGVPAEGTYFLYTIGTGTFEFVPALNKDETLKIYAY